MKLLIDIMIGCRGRAPSDLLFKLISAQVLNAMGIPSPLCQFEKHARKAFQGNISPSANTP